MQFIYIKYIIYIKYYIIYNIYYIHIHVPIIWYSKNKKQSHFQCFNVCLLQKTTLQLTFEIFIYILH